jgi:hypothetical protein
MSRAMGDRADDDRSRPSVREERRRRHALIERRHAWLRERLAQAQNQILEGEALLNGGVQGPWRGQYLTERRVILVWQPGTVGRWVHDSVWYDEATDWEWDEEHDGRPFVVIRHPTHLRPGRVPAHRFLWFRWGIAERPVPHVETKVSFRSRRDRAIKVVRAGLERATRRSDTDTDEN